MLACPQHTKDRLPQPEALLQAVLFLKHTQKPVERSSSAHCGLWLPDDFFPLPLSISHVSGPMTGLIEPALPGLCPWIPFPPAGSYCLFSQGTLPATLREFPAVPAPTTWPPGF